MLVFTEDYVSNKGIYKAHIRFYSGIYTPAGKSKEKLSNTSGAPIVKPKLKALRGRKKRMNPVKDAGQ